MTGGRPSRAITLAELAVVLLIFLADSRGYVFFSKTPILLLLGWASLRWRGQRWADVGLARPQRWRRALLLGALGGVLSEAFALGVTQPLLARLTGRQPDLSDFRPLVGNPTYLLLGLLLSWTLAAFGEEAVYRGYLMNRVADLGPRTRGAWIASLFVVSVLFGFAHAYQGPAGVLEEGLAGLLLGLMYLGCGRNLVVPVVAHGLQDTIDLVLIFLGRFPGMQS